MGIVLNSHRFLPIRAELAADKVFQTLREDENVDGSRESTKSRFMLVLGTFAGLQGCGEKLSEGHF
jgi:hypothetical protein